MPPRALEPIQFDNGSILSIAVKLECTVPELFNILLDSASKFIKHLHIMQILDIFKIGHSHRTQAQQAFAAHARDLH